MSWRSSRRPADVATSTSSPRRDEDLEAVIMTLGEWTVRWLFKEPLPARRRPGDVDVVDAPPGRHRGDAGRPGRDPVRLPRHQADDRSGSCSTVASRPCARTTPASTRTSLVTTDSVSLMRVFSGIDELRGLPRQRPHPHRRAAVAGRDSSRRGSCGARSPTPYGHDSGRRSGPITPPGSGYERDRDDDARCPDRPRLRPRRAARQVPRRARQAAPRRRQRAVRRGRRASSPTTSTTRTSSRSSASR